MKKVIQFNPIWESAGNYYDWENGIHYFTVYEQIILLDQKGAKDEKDN